MPGRAGLQPRGTDALNDAEDKVKSTWSDDLKRAYNHLAAQSGAEVGGKKASKDDGKFDRDVLETARKVLAADEETEIMRLDAEDTFAAPARANASR